MLILLIIVGLIGATLINKRGWNYYNFTHPDKQLSFNEYLSDNSSVWTKMKSGIPFFVFDSTQNPDQKNYVMPLTNIPLVFIPCLMLLF
jgi:hypothetical protein